MEENCNFVQNDNTTSKEQTNENRIELRFKSITEEIHTLSWSDPDSIGRQHITNSTYTKRVKQQQDTTVLSTKQTINKTQHKEIETNSKSVTNNIKQQTSEEKTINKASSYSSIIAILVLLLLIFILIIFIF